MLEKIYERERENEFVKGYNSDYNIIEFIQSIEEGEHQIKGIKVTDDADVGLKSFGGTYTFEGFYELYENYSACIERVGIDFYDIPVRIDIYDNGRIIMLAYNQDIELEDIVSKKKRFN